MGEAIVGGNERRDLERTNCLSLVWRPVIPRLVILWPNRPNALSLLLEKFPGQQVCRWNGLEPGLCPLLTCGLTMVANSSKTSREMPLTSMVRGGNTPKITHTFVTRWDFYA